MLADDTQGKSTRSINVLDSDQVTRPTVQVETFAQGFFGGDAA